MNVRFGQLLDEFRVLPGVLNSGVPEELKPRALRIIHEEKRNPVVGSEVAGREHLAIALVVCEGEL